MLLIINVFIFLIPSFRLLVLSVALVLAQGVVAVVVITIVALSQFIHFLLLPLSVPCRKQILILLLLLLLLWRAELALERRAEWCWHCVKMLYCVRWPADSVCLCHDNDLTSPTKQTTIDSLRLICLLIHCYSLVLAIVTSIVSITISITLLLRLLLLLLSLVSVGN